MLTWEIALPLMTLAFVLTITPGPNNVLLLASGLAFGFRRTGRQMAGIVTGVFLQIVLVGAGLGALFARFPHSQLLLKCAGSLYMAWLAAKLWRAGRAEAVTLARPIGFREATAFQFLNPKVWLMATTVVSAFVPPGGHYAARLASVGLLYCATAFPCICVWAACGEALRRWVQDPVALRRLNRAMAVLALATVLLFWL